MLNRRLRLWVVTLAFAGLGVTAMVAAIWLDVPCGLDCPPDDDVTLSDALAQGTGLSPPVLMIVGVPLLGWLSRHARWPGFAASVILELVAFVMTYAWFADSATVSAIQGGYGAWAAVVAAAMLAGVLVLLVSAMLEVWHRATRRKDPTTPVDPSNA